MRIPRIGWGTMCPQFTAKDVGKRVHDENGEDIGMVTDVDQGVAHVEPDPGITDSIKAALGWSSPSGDTVTLRESDVSRITDDVVHLGGQSQSDMGTSGRQSATGGTDDTDVLGGGSASDMATRGHEHETATGDMPEEEDDGILGSDDDGGLLGDDDDGVMGDDDDSIFSDSNSSERERHSGDEGLMDEGRENDVDRHADEPRTGEPRTGAGEEPTHGHDHDHDTDSDIDLERDESPLEDDSDDESRSRADRDDE